ncbi:MAG: hypothetical protein E7006_03685 [Alphaproteobacteria bacterium]|nr:hypothetical protein [Alphaproteobacteria bacterium]
MESKRTVPFWLIIALMILVIGGMIYLLFGSPQKTEKIMPVGAPAIRLDENVARVRRAPANFTDGLHNPNETSTYQLDETGAGISNQTIYYRDINGDGISDRITRSHYENGTSHYWDSYTIELVQNGKYRDITPENFRTTHGAECSLTQIQFSFAPKFQIVKISRPWHETWNSPSVATRTIYELSDNKLVISSQKKLQSVCDVTELFLAE